MMCKTTPWLVAATCFAATPALAQDTSAPNTAEAEAPKTPEVTKTDLEAIEKLIEAQRKRLEALEAAGDAASKKAKALEEQLAAAEEERMDLMTQMMEAQDTGDKLFSIFGFMDAGFGHYDYRANDLLSTYVISEPTFVTSNINLYFKSELTPQLETLIETRLTFAPNGDEANYPTRIYVGGNQIGESGTYERGNTSAGDRLTAASFNWGGIVIERAHIDYKPFEWLKVRVGRFLTPYGIWNVDHGSPVLIGTSLPQLVSSQQVPNNQTGIQIFGRVFPTDTMKLDYALFASNGRGPTEAIYDLDANKALGARAKLSMTFGKIQASIGAFGYWGKYTDAQQNVSVQATPDLKADFQNNENPIGTEKVILEQYDEAVIAADFDIRAYGFRLFGEGTIRRVQYDVRPALDNLIFLANGGRLGSSAEAADFIAKAGYLILTYDVPTEFLKEGSFVRPYVGIERIEQSDAHDVFNYTVYRMGLNLHPNPYLVWKFQAIRVGPDRDDVIGNFWGFTSQVAVSF